MYNPLQYGLQEGLQGLRMKSETENRTRTSPGTGKPLHSRLRHAVFAVLGLLLAAVAVFLADGRHPQFHVMTGLEVETPLGSPFEDPGVYAVLTGRLFGTWERRLPVRTVGTVDTSVPGTSELSYLTDYLFREYRCTRKVHVVDRTPPVITLYSREGDEVNWLEGYREEGFHAEDNPDGYLAAFVSAERRGNAIFYTVTDRAGNTATAERRPNYTVGPPELRLLGAQSLTLPAGLDRYADPGCTAADTFGHDMTGRVEVQGEVLPWRAGTYDLVYSVTNGAGDTVRTLRRVTVEAVPLPEPVEPEGKTIYLTFDDGPGPYTDRLLDVLDRYGARATFFVTCDQPDYFRCIARAHAAGHTVGIHTASHVYQEIYSGEAAFFEDFRRVRDLILEQTGEYPVICRFPGGSSNTVSEFNPGIMTRLASDVTDLGIQYFDWDVYSGDAGGKGATTESDRVFENVVSGIDGRRRAVVLQHDIKSFSVDAVEKIILWGQENGYTFRALDAASPPVHDDIAN